MGARVVSSRVRSAFPVRPIVFPRLADSSVNSLEMHSMKRSRFLALATAASLAATMAVACSDSGGLPALLGSDGTMGNLVVRLTDAPFLTDSLKSVDIFV